MAAPPHRPPLAPGPPHHGGVEERSFHGPLHGFPPQGGRVLHAGEEKEGDTAAGEELQLLLQLQPRLTECLHARGWAAGGLLPAGLWDPFALFSQQTEPSLHAPA